MSAASCAWMVIPTTIMALVALAIIVMAWTVVR